MSNSFENSRGMNNFFPPRCNSRPPCPPPFPPFQQRQVFLSSATGSAGPLPLITTLLAAPINIVTTSIDTTGIINSTNLLIFTSQISLPLGISVNLNFEILRSANGGSAVKIGSTYTFATLVNILESEAFSFQFADTNVPEGNYTYSVQLSTNSVLDITPGLTINNATLSVLAVKS